jgi:adenylate kinase family enzyme
MLKHGMLAPESKLRYKLWKRLSMCEHFILDGFPRNHDQLDQLYKWLAPSPQIIFCEIVCSIDLCKERLLSRLREDDHAEAIVNRIMYYNDNTKQLTDFISASDILIKSHNKSDTKIEEIATSLMRGIENVKDFLDR